MADLLSLVLANHRKARAQSQNDNGNDMTEHIKRATTELHPDIQKLETAGDGTPKTAG
jgi:hypothetical protein